VLGGIRGCLGCILCHKRLRLSLEVDRCKPLPLLHTIFVPRGRGVVHRIVRALEYAPDVTARGSHSDGWSGRCFSGRFGVLSKPPSLRFAGVTHDGGSGDPGRVSHRQSVGPSERPHVNYEQTVR